MAGALYDENGKKIGELYDRSREQQASVPQAGYRGIGAEEADLRDAEARHRAEQIRRQRELMPDLDHSQARPTQYTPEQLADQRGSYPTSSQAGLAAAQGPRRSYPSVPSPGQPGSRFNPVVRERRSSTPERRPGGPDMIRSSDVPRAPQQAAEPKKQARKQARRDERELTKKMTKDGAKAAVAGAKIGAKAGSVVPGLGTTAGGVIGAGVAGSQAQAKAAREAGNTKMAFVTGMPAGGLVGGAVNAKRAAKVRDEQKQAAAGQVSQQGPTQAQTGAGVRQPTRVEKFKESKLGQKVQSEEFKSGAKRVGSEAMRSAASAAQAAKSSGASGKGVMASVVKGAAVGAAHGVRSEMAKSKQAQSDPSKADAGGMITQMGHVVDKASSERAAQPGKQDKPLSERYDYQFEQPNQPDESGPELGR